MDLQELYRWICIPPEWSTTDPSVALHSGVLQNPKYLNTSSTDPAVVLHSGDLLYFEFCCVLIQLTIIYHY